MKQLDLGCGNIPRPFSDDYEIFGVDIATVENPNVKTADLAFEKIPFASDEFDLVTAYDFMEHVPSFIYVSNYNQGTLMPTVTPRKVNSMVNLFNEIYRVMKPNAEFYFVSPVYPSIEAFRDPTHVFFWTSQTMHYFSGDYYGMHEHYGHTSKFELLQNQVVGSRLEVRVRAIKPCEPPYDVGSVT